MKKILLIICSFMLITGCSKTCDNQDLNVYNGTSSSILEYNKNFSIKISGAGDYTITYDDIKDLIENEETVNVISPLHNSEKKYIGFNLKDLFDRLNISNYEAMYVVGENTTQRITLKNIVDCYIVLVEDGIELENPKFVKYTISDIYTVKNVNEIILGSDVGV